ncbi:hypothetical protein BO221_20035 [Archangium sp. Cb G35]|uniref:hypothetical protein n=1 Tax=Archangium sp. Cb G35 TaxID=1920190 RepID=UPI000936F994|nr:hypothetical protein [Archangium sp. Cb G35]OJT23164.1 hypothetical protein BO221_20035 [Archangium sp. Cb G35]
MKSVFKKSLLASGVALLLTGCGSTTEAEPQPSSLETREDELLSACGEPEATELLEVAEHACYHAEYGPFETVTAAALGTTPFVDVSTPHTAYNITLPARSFGYGGAVNFIPEESGEYAFLLSRHRGLRIFNGNTEVARECRLQVPAETCDSLRTTIVADLEANVEYRLEFKAIFPQNAQFTLLVEEAGHHHEE